MITEQDVRDSLKRFPLYHPGQVVIVAKPFIRDAVCVSYRTTRGDSHNTTHLSLQFEGDICYIVSIGLDPMYRGAGLGQELYTIAENIARQTGCRKMVMNASGTTVNSRTRKDYAKKRLGYRDIPGSIEVEKDL